MAVLSDGDRKLARQLFTKQLSRDREACAVGKTDLKAAVDAVDDWVNSNQASYNSALPVAARTNLTASQKARLLVFVVERRFKEGV